ncbi:DUF418 domain-containing protein [Marinactinospora rubrisoli]|uniref:DUF418 domain-containing protein n=1 Tax=Marinactinospora rubrisoli TaxID=2715399 RepID=A0ABW2KAS5_9ACTN
MHKDGETATPPPARTEIRGPARSTERALAPDLARGFMLLLIALANTVYYLWGAERSGGSVHPADGSVLDRIVQAVIIIAVDQRVYPMFAFLFGYGIVQLLNRQLASGAPEGAARALLRRRHLWMIAFGFAHAALLWMGDIIGAYGLVGLVLCWLFLRRADRVLLTWAAVGVAVLTLATAASTVLAVAGGAGDAAEAEDVLTLLTGNISSTDYLVTVPWRIGIWLVIMVTQGFVLLAVPVAVLLAFWAARHRVLEEPGRHLPLLRAVAAGGITLGWVSAVPHALDHVRVLEVSAGATEAFVTPLGLTGLLAGLGYVAAFALVAHRIGSRGAHGRVVTALSAVGKRSMSAYLAQSVLCAPLLSAWGLGLGGSFGSWQMAAFAVGVWLVTVAGAYALERAGRRGPAETALRRLAYPRPAPRPDAAAERA